MQPYEVGQLYPYQFDAMLEKLPKVFSITHGISEAGESGASATPSPSPADWSKVRKSHAMRTSSVVRDLQRGKYDG